MYLHFLDLSRNSATNATVHVGADQQGRSDLGGGAGGADSVKFRTLKFMFKFLTFSNKICVKKVVIFVK
jgi:hypothetical protein